VAAALGIPLGTAKSRLHRSLLLMRSELAADDRRDALGPQRGAFA
jgi:DNA-directed RNA polymerase specialized sigma24 family protein